MTQEEVVEDYGHVVGFYFLHSTITNNTLLLI